MMGWQPSLLTTLKLPICSGVTEIRLVGLQRHFPRLVYAEVDEYDESYLPDESDEDNESDGAADV
jgi:hypothetical protein